MIAKKYNVTLVSSPNQRGSNNINAEFFSYDTAAFIYVDLFHDQTGEGSSLPMDITDADIITKLRPIGCKYGIQIDNEFIDHNTIRIPVRNREWKQEGRFAIDVFAVFPDGSSLDIGSFNINLAKSHIDRIQA